MTPNYMCFVEVRVVDGDLHEVLGQQISPELRGCLALSCSYSSKVHELNSSKITPVFERGRSESDVKWVAGVAGRRQADSAGAGEGGAGLQ